MQFLKLYLLNWKCYGLSRVLWALLKFLVKFCHKISELPCQLPWNCHMIRSTFSFVIQVPKFGTFALKIGAKYNYKYDIAWFRTTSTFAVNISHVDRDVKNRKSEWSSATILALFGKKMMNFGPRTKKVISMHVVPPKINIVHGDVWQLWGEFLPPVFPQSDF